MAGEGGMFEDLSGLHGVTFLEGNSPQQIEDQLKQIRLPCRILGAYGYAGKHFMWIQTTAPIRKKRAAESKKEI